MNLRTMSLPGRLWLVMLGCALPGCGTEKNVNKAAVEQYRDLARAIVREALVAGETYQKLRQLCRVAPHRLAGSEGAQRAVEWARQAMIRDGLENVRLDPVMVSPWDRGQVESLRILAPEGGAGEPLTIAALGGSLGTPPGGIVGEVLEVKSFEELRERSTEARGKIVFFNRPMDPAEIHTFRAYGGAVDQRTHGAAEAARAGGVAAIVRSVTTRNDDVPHTGSISYASDVQKVPAAAVSAIGSDRLSALLASGEPVRVHLELSCKRLADVLSYNVIGEITGSERPEEIVVVGGHLDAWDKGQGAHDDGAGCCHSIEALRLVRKLGIRPKRTLRAVLFMGEETGVRGAKAYYRNHMDEMERHVLGMESDRGGFTPRGFATDAGPEARTVLEAIAALLQEIGADRVVAGGGGADVGVMRQSGVPTIGLVPDSQRYFDVHHSANDVLESINQRELELGSAAIAVMIAVVADLPERLPRNQIPE